MGVVECHKVLCCSCRVGGLTDRKQQMLGRSYNLLLLLLLGELGCHCCNWYTLQILTHREFKLLLELNNLCSQEIQSTLLCLSYMEPIGPLRGQRDEIALQIYHCLHRPSKFLASSCHKPKMSKKKGRNNPPVWRRSLLIRKQNQKDLIKSKETFVWTEIKTVHPAWVILPPPPHWSWTVHSNLMRIWMKKI